MMHYTDQHCRVFHRIISKNILLYTEMVNEHAIVHGNRDRLIGFDKAEHPVALQVGGSHPDLLAIAAKHAEEYGYDEINLNVGCPSDRVQSGEFGLCLMKRPEHVRDCVQAMAEAVKIPVTVKTRTGVDDMDDYEHLCHFIETVKQAPVQHFAIHARKGWLKGLSPKENRDIPPLQYDRVYQLKKDYPELEIAINGGVQDLNETAEHLNHVDGVMIGRAAYHTPYILAEADQRFFGGEAPLTRHEIIEAYLPYIEDQLSKGTRLTSMTRHILGLFHGQPAAKTWRRMISQHAHEKSAGIDLILKALPSYL